MTRKSRLETDFRRFLAKCEQFISQRSGDDEEENDDEHESEQRPHQAPDWRRAKYVEALEEKLSELRRINVCQPDEDDLADYARRVKLLRGIVDAEKLASPAQRWMACELLSPAGTTSTRKGVKTREMRLQATSRYAQEMRKDLLGPGKSHAQPTGNDIEQVIKYHNTAQEKAAQEMLALTQSLKQNCSLAGHLIKKDVESLEKTKQIAEKNTVNLNKNSDKLSDFVRRSCQYWLWIMLGVVCVTFLWMVVFIRMFPKRTYSPPHPPSHQQSPHIVVD